MYTRSRQPRARTSIARPLPYPVTVRLLWTSAVFISPTRMKVALMSLREPRSHRNKRNGEHMEMDLTATRPLSGLRDSLFSILQARRESFSRKRKLIVDSTTIGRLRISMEICLFLRNRSFGGQFYSHHKCEIL